MARVTSTRMVWTGEYNEAAMAKAAAKAARDIAKAAAKFGNPLTEAEAAEGGRQYVEMYRHHFRIYVPAPREVE